MKHCGPENHHFSVSILRRIADGYEVKFNNDPEDFCAVAAVKALRHYADHVEKNGPAWGG
jgi:hypothetical protein